MNGVDDDPLVQTHGKEKGAGPHGAERTRDGVIAFHPLDARAGLLQHPAILGIEGLALDFLHSGRPRQHDSIPIHHRDGRPGREGPFREETVEPVQTDGHRHHARDIPRVVAKGHGKRNDRVAGRPAHGVPPGAKRFPLKASWTCSLSAKFWPIALSKVPQTTVPSGP